MSAHESRGDAEYLEIIERLKEENRLLKGLLELQALKMKNSRPGINPVDAQFLESTNLIRIPRLHRRADAQGLMNTGAV